ncbi:hypothetical protein ACHAXM_002083 [Skeletonema potamos]
MPSYDDMRPLLTSIVIVDRLLHQTTLADRMWLYPSLITIPRSLPGLLIMYLAILTLWIPCWLLSHVTSELGVYLFIIACFVHICHDIGNQVSNTSTSTSTFSSDVANVDFEIGDVRMIVIPPGGSFDFTLQPQPQTLQDGNGEDFCSNDDPQCMLVIV